MSTGRLSMVFWCLAALAGAGVAQSWSTAYDQGLQAAREGAWLKAREAFKQATAFRPEDQSGVTLLPGPATEKRRWRDGAPYSPNFLAAYCSYRAANDARDSETRTRLLKEVAQELKGLMAKGQASYEATFYLGSCYTQLGDVQSQRALEESLASRTGPLTWKVDTEIIAPEELAQISQLAGRDQPVTAVTSDVTAGGGASAGGATTPAGAPPVAPKVGVRVPPIATKYALVIGNSESRLSEGSLPFAADDAQLVREALVSSAGYPEENVDIVVNATAAQLAASAKALADRIPEGATVFIFFAGVGINVAGKDYLAGVDTESPTNVASMMAKADLFKMFIGRGARVYAFFEANRPISEGRFFGQEVPMFGQIAQAQATIPGQSVYSLVKGGKSVGAYADAISSVLAEFRSNRVPILEFGWQVFYRIRRGDTGTAGGSSNQTPTLPVLTNLAADSKF